MHYLRAFVLMLLLAVSSNAQGYTWNLGAAMIFRDDGPYLKEWIEYHRLIGVEHFYLYNHLSQDNCKEILQPYIETGVVELIEWPYEFSDLGEWTEVQLTAYEEAIKRAKGEVKWLAIIDSDEFLLPVHSDDLRQFLKTFENKTIGSVSAKWCMFGTSYVKKIPEDQLMIEALTMNKGFTTLGKTICRPERVQKVGNAHYVKLKASFKNQGLNPHSQLRINHYWSRDEYYLENHKIPTREKWGTPAETTRYMAESFNQVNAYGATILRFVPLLKELLQPLNSG